MRCWLLMMMAACINLSSRGAVRPSDCDSLVVAALREVQNTDYAKALSLLTQAGDLSRKHHWIKQQFLADNNTGMVYYLMYDYGEALTWYLQAYEIAVAGKETKLEMTVLNNIAVLYSREKEFDKALPYFEKAYSLAKENRKPANIGYYAINLGTLYNETGNLTLAKTYLEEAIANLRDVPDKLMCARITLADNYRLQGNTRKAEALSIPLLKAAKDSGYRDMQSQALLVLMKSYLADGRQKEAVEMAAQARLASTDLEEQITIHSLLADIYTRDGIYHLALPHKDSVIRLKDSLYDVRNGRIFENRKVKFELQNYQHELALQTQKTQEQRVWFFVSCGFILLAGGFTIWLLRNKAVQASQKRIIAEHDKKIAELEREQEKNEKLLLENQLREAETAALLEEERLKNELERKNRNLLAKSVYLSDRNGQIEEVLSSLSGLSDGSIHEGLGKQITQLRNHIQKGEETENFIRHFEEVNTGFVHTLQQKHPAVTANDVRFLSYVYMNLSNKEIGSLLSITPEGCRKRKERITRKMELPPDVSLYQYLQEM